MQGHETVLVTGGSGFIGGWCVIRLLQQGYTVRTTVRRLAHEHSVRAAFGKLIDVQDRLSFHAAELTSDAGWEVATSGCDFVLHVASPVVLSQPRNPNELIAPARDGTRRVVDAAIKSGVRRVVLTSSVAAASRNAKTVETVSDETVWTDLSDAKVSAYARSKTLAECMAWHLIASSGGATTLVAVNPSVVLGPVLSGDYSASVQVVERLLSGKIPGIPRLGFNVVDVRDVADLHICAMTAPEAAGQRFIAPGPSAGWRISRSSCAPASAMRPTRFRRVGFRTLLFGWRPSSTRSCEQRYRALARSAISRRRRRKACSAGERVRWRKPCSTAPGA